jgi:hypothetical protein
MGLALDGDNRFDWTESDLFCNCWRHHINCDFWFDQYADECTCGLTARAATNPVGNAMMALPYRDDQIIDAAMARALHADACRGHACVAWVVLWDLPAYPERYAVRLATSTASPLPAAC